MQYVMSRARAIALVGVVGLAGCGSVEDPSAPDGAPAVKPDAGAPDAGPTEPDCVRSSETRTDPNTQRTWTVIWSCRNDGGAPLYLEPKNGSTLVANMDTVWSWYVCYRRGDLHIGGNDVWYYTQGDRAAPGGAGRDEWGFMPSFNVKSAVHPVPGLPEC